MKDRIVLIPPFSWKVRVATFVSSFGIIWLFVDPLATLGVGSSLLSSLGVWGYWGLIICSAFFTIIIEYVNRKRMMGKMSFITLTIISTEYGTNNLVEVPQDMRVSMFLHLFLKYASKNASSDTFLSRHHFYNVTLLVERNGKYEEVPNNLTIAEAGLVNSDICRISGIIKKEFIIALYREDKF